MLDGLKDSDPLAGFSRRRETATVLRANLVTLVVLVAAGWSAACAHQPQPYVPKTEAEDSTLPSEWPALLALSDEAAALGPGGPDLSRSLAAANRILSANPKHGGAAWRAARALYLQTYATPGDLGALTASCMNVSAVATAYLPQRAEAHYYAALCMGARAKARKLEGLDLVPRMEKAGKAALVSDPKVAEAGPHRLLGGIYLWAPAWPASIGDLDLAIEHLENAVELAPEWAENHILLAYALFEDEEYDGALEALEAGKKRLDHPRAVGWRPYWQEQIEELEGKIAEQME